MAQGEIRPFLGTIPRLDKTLLPENHAQIAMDCYLKRGTLKPAQGFQSAGSLLSGTRSFYRYNREANNGEGFWFQWSDEGVSVAPSPIIDDIWRRVYWTGQGGPRFTGADVATSGDGPHPSVSYQLGLPAPGALASSAPAGDPPADAIQVEATYVMTFVDKYGAEGPPSPATDLVTRWDGLAVGLSELEVPSGNFVIETKRIYRSETLGVYQLVAEIPASSTSFSDQLDTAMMGVILPSEGWLAPNPDMQGLTTLPNGVIMGWWDNVIAFCEPYRPHAWPIEYRHRLEDRIVGAGLSDVGIVVATEGKPYLITGADPASFQETKLDLDQACLSRRSVVDMGRYVAYASADGIVGNGQVLTGSHITSEQFQALNPESMHAYRWNDRYLCFYVGQEGSGAFTFHPEEGFLWYSMGGDYGYLDKKTGDVYLKDLFSTAFNVWHRGNPLPYRWRSGVLQPRLLTMPKVVRVEAETYPVTFRYYADGQLLKTETVTSRRAFRLPANRQVFDVEIELEGTATVRAVQVATAMSELR